MNLTQSTENGDGVQMTENNLVKFEGQHEVMILMKEDVNFDFKGDYLLRAKDVASGLEYTQTNDFVSLIKPKYVYKVRNSNLAKSQNRKLHNTGETFISSFGLSQGLANSTMPKAEPFQDWLFEEMLPSIQKNGYYVMGSNLRTTSKLEIETKKINVREAYLLLKIANCKTTEPTYSRVLHAKAVELVSGERLLPMPKVERATYSAGEVAEKVGLNRGQAVGTIANRINIKPPMGEKNEFGEWTHSKAQYSSKQVKQFMYTDAGVEAIRKEVV